MTEASATPMLAHEPCAYCTVERGSEEDHVIARQFFPKTGSFRANLPKVPCCARCNRAKQRVEDGVAVWFQLGDGSPGSAGVVEERLRRTLTRNQRLARTLRERTKRVWARTPGGILTRRLALVLPPELLRDAHQWFTYIARGLYRHESGTVLPVSHRILLIRPTNPAHYRYLLGWLSRIPDHISRSLGSGEFRYLMAQNPAELLSLWLVSFRSIDIAALTIGPDCPQLLSAALERIEWKAG